MGQVKIPWYSQRLMHWKRVTCELHDSYFRLMTIKHAIPKILSGRLNYYITQWRQEVSLETRPVGEKMLEWEHVPERLGPQGPCWAAQENENDTWRCPEGLGRSICCSLCSVSHTQPFQIKWEVYFLKKSSLVFIIASICILHVYVYSCIFIMWLYNIRIHWPQIGNGTYCSKVVIHFGTELIHCCLALVIWQKLELYAYPDHKSL